MNRLPLVEFVKNSYLHQNLSNVRIIGHQHLLETTYTALLSLFDLGLKPKNVHLLGKCYSSNVSTYNKMQKIGINVPRSSFHYDSHLPYDNFFENKMNIFLNNILKTSNFDDFEKTIVLDDGGYAINVINQLQLPYDKIVGIEQTTSGYEKVKKLNLNFPVINIARSEAKLIHETPMIAEITINKLSDFLSTQATKISSALIIGGGFIGQGIYHKIHRNIKTTIYDKSSSLSHINEESFKDNLANSDLIIGCTGTKSVPKEFHQYIQKSLLVSASSSDREFDAVNLRQLRDRNFNCHEHLNIQNITLANSGFPINFDGGNHSVSPEKIQLTRSLIILGIFQSLETSHSEKIINLNQKKQEEIIKEYYNISSDTKEKKVNFLTI